KMGDADPANYFVSDNTDYIVTREGDEAIIRYPDLTGVSADDVKFDYDGKSHAITVTAPEGATVTYGTEEGEYSLSNSPAYTEAGTYTVYYKVSKDKFTPATGSATVTVEKIDVTVTVTGHTGSADYDACEHTVTGYDVTASNALYDVTNDFTFGGTASVSGTNAGTYNMGLKAEQFTNTNPNFKTVTFNVTDGYVTVNPIDVTVTVTGHTVTADYNGNAHSADGYDAEFSTDLYSRSDFIYNGRAEAVRTDAGTTAMGLKTELFENKNDNFSSVTFVVTDGYVTVNTVDAVIITAPISVRPVYSGSMIDLIAASEAEGGTVYYALGEDPRNAPADESFDTAIPKAKEIGSYYVWYKVVADSNHNDISPAYVKVVLAEDDWVILSGVLYESDGKTPIGDSVVTLTKGNEKIDYVITDSLGNYEFTVPTGTYNIVAEGHGVSSTELVKVFKNTSRNFKMSAGKTESIVKVTDNENGNSGITVGGLSSEAYYIRESEKIDDETNVSVLITVETKADNTAENSGAFSTLMRRKSFVFFDVKLEKTIGSKTTSLNKTANVMEIAVPYEKINRRGLSVYNADGDTIRTFKEASTGEDGTYSIDKENGFVYIYTNKFSTFAIGYVPYYKVESNVSLGSFEGNATVILEGQNGEGDYKLEDVDLSEISFADIPKGEYKMTVTWEDGATNTLTMPLAVS
ncbi:MAG: hypothetical protein J6T73_05850, partial [Clostridia bacterium]|nr:hypothetical protein [Clostridia bacterium]